MRGPKGIPQLGNDRRAHRRAGHALHAGGHHHVIGTRHDALGGEVDRLLGGPALPVDRGRGDRLRPAGGEHRHPAHVEALLADLHDAAPDDVLDQGGSSWFRSCRRPQGLGGEVDGVPVAELPVALAAGGADGVDDDCGGHGVSSQFPAGTPDRLQNECILPASFKGAPPTTGSSEP